MSRSSYRGLMGKPAWLLYNGEELIASVRADDADDARELFRAAGLRGTHVRRADSPTEVRAAMEREARRVVRGTA